MSKQAPSPPRLHLTVCEPEREPSGVGVTARPRLPCEDAVQPLFGRAAGAGHALVRGPRPRPRPTMWCANHHRAACEQMGAPRSPAAADLGRARA